MSDHGYRKTRLNETRFVGRLTAEQVSSALLAAVRDLVGLPSYTDGLSIVFDIEGAPEAREAAFVLVQDHDYYLRLKPFSDPV